MLIIMFGFDDEFKTDVKLAGILEKHGFEATFFVTASKVVRVLHGFQRMIFIGFPRFMGLHLTR